MPDTDILNEEQLKEIEADIEQWSDFPKLQSKVRALCRTLRAAWNKHERLKSKIARHRDGVGPDVPVLQERYDKLIAENTALREQLAEAHKNVESLSQTIFRSEQATRMRELYVEKVKALTEPHRLAVKYGSGSKGQNSRAVIRFSNEVIAALEAAATTEKGESDG